MKKIIKNTFITLMLILLLSGVNTAQERNIRIDKNAIESLTNGIRSDNLGLKRSSIYLAGKYKLRELVNTLIDELEKTDNEQIKILTALTLGEIGDKVGIEAIKKMIFIESNRKAKSLFIAVYEEAVT